MNRLTKAISPDVCKEPSGKPNFSIEPGTYGIDTDCLSSGNGFYTGIAADRLAAFENMAEDLQTAQEMVIAEMDSLRMEGKEKTVRFKELMTKKLTNMNLLILLKGYGIE